MAATKNDDEDGEKWAKTKCTTPNWGADAKNWAHLWCRTSASGDMCYLGGNGCTGRGLRIKCSSCKIIVHTECLKGLISNLKVLCRKTFLDAENGSYREKTDVPHHWIAKKTAKGRCRTCSKNFGGKVSKLLNESIGLSCSWCKEVCHNKDTCYDAQKLSTERCDLGAHSNIIVPPTWIVKLPVEETENSKQMFVVKPIPSANSTPLLVFINPKSGGNQGSRLLRTFQWLLNPRQIFDLTEGGPGHGLELYKRVPNLRILACGGDGTVGWVLSVLDNLKLCASPPVAVLPLGTGNDLARALGWGGGYTDEPISKILTNIQDGEIVKLDRWILNVNPNESANSNNAEEGRKNLPLTVVNNYFSLGVDALIALEFHEAREAQPKKFNSRIRNKIFYGQAGGKDLIQRKWKDLCNFVTLECDGQDMTPKLKELRVHSILFLNISSYGGGTKPWGGCSQFQAPSTDDGLIEVVGLTTYQLPLLQAGCHGSPIAQCRRAKLVTTCSIPVQVDGEPCRLLPSLIDMELLNTVSMIAKSKKHGAAMRKENVEKISLPLKLIPLLNYEVEHQRKSALKDGATDFGTVTISYNTDLAEIRPQISKLLEEKEQINRDAVTEIVRDPESGQSSRRCSKITSWWFLDSCSGDKFFRIDEAQEHLYYVNDICDEDLYILEQSESADDIINDYLKVELEGDDVSRASTSSSGRQSLDSGEEGEVEDPSAAQDEIEEEAGIEPVTAPSSPSLLAPTQIFVEPELEMSDAELNDQEYAEGMLDEGNDTLSSLPSSRKASATSLKIDESEMDLITAAKFGCLNRVAELHNSGSSLGSRDNQGRTALHHAAYLGNIGVVRYLAAYAPISVLDATDNMMYYTALHCAALRRDKVVCSILVSAGASLDIRDKQGCTAQELADAVGDKKLAEYLESVAEPVIL